MAGLLAADHGITSDRHPYMRFEPFSVSLMASTVMKDGVDPAATEYSLGRQSLLDAFCPPRETPGGGLHGPDAIVDAKPRGLPPLRGSETDGVAERQKCHRGGSGRQNDERLQQ